MFVWCSGALFINRSGALFGYVLHSLCTGTAQCPPHIDASAMSLELEYYDMAWPLPPSAVLSEAVKQSVEMHVTAPGVDVRGEALDGLCVRHSDLSKAKMAGVSLKGATLEACNLLGFSMRAEVHSFIVPNPKLGFVGRFDP